MTPRDAIETALQKVGEVSIDELPALCCRLREAELVAETRLRAIEQQKPEEPKEDRLLTPEEAGEIARVSKRRIYAWATGQRWASRPSRGCLRIKETAFRNWLSTRNVR
jgi:hypothetical protein